MQQFVSQLNSKSLIHNRVNKGGIVSNGVDIIELVSNYESRGFRFES